MGEMDKVKILIAEDDEDLLALYNKVLPDPIFEKRMVRDGIRALDVYEAWRPDILLIDIVMPIKTGCSVIRDIRWRMRNSDITIVVSSSVDDIKEVEGCSDLDIEGYIQKPFNYKKLAQVILEFYKEKSPDKAANALFHLPS